MYAQKRRQKQIDQIIETAFEDERIAPRLTEKNNEKIIKKIKALSKHPVHKKQVTIAYFCFFLSALCLIKNKIFPTTADSVTNSNDIPFCDYIPLLYLAGICAIVTQIYCKKKSETAALNYFFSLPDENKLGITTYSDIIDVLSERVILDIPVEYYSGERILMDPVRIETEMEHENERQWVIISEVYERDELEKLIEEEGCVPGSGILFDKTFFRIVSDELAAKEIDTFMRKTLAQSTVLAPITL